MTGSFWNGAADYGQLFGETISNPLSAIGAQFIFMLCTIFVVSKGVEKGIEKASKYMMPLLFILFIAIIVRALTLDGALLSRVLLKTRFFKAYSRYDFICNGTIFLLANSRCLSNGNV